MTSSLYISYDGVLEPLGESQVVAYLEGLNGSDTRFTLLTFEKLQYETPEGIIEMRQRLGASNIQWIKLRYHKRPAVISTAYDIICGIISCLSIVKKEKIGVVHARSYVASLIALCLKKIFKVKFIFDMRGFWADERVEGRLWKGKGAVYKAAKYFEKCFFFNADEVVVLTEHAKGIIRKWGYRTDNVSVIPCCANTNTFKFRSDFRDRIRQLHGLRDKFVFIHAGSLEYWYIKEHMLDYFSEAKKLVPNAHFLILAHCDKERILEFIQAKKDLSMSDFTIISARFSDMPGYLSAADAGLFFITPVFTKLASSPTKFAEYLSCGLPVIINDRIGDMEDYVIKNRVGVVIKNFCVDEYQKTFKEFMDLKKDPGLRDRCRRVACDNFGLETGVDKYLQVYSRLIK